MFGLGGKAKFLRIPQFPRFLRNLPGHYSVVLFSVFKNFLKLKREDLISWGAPILQND